MVVAAGRPRRSRTPGSRSTGSTPSGRARTCAEPACRSPSPSSCAARCRAAEFRARLRRARVFVHGARWEDWGQAPLEALADGALLATVPSGGPVRGAPAGARARRRRSWPTEIDPAAARRGDPRGVRDAGGAGARLPRARGRAAAPVSLGRGAGGRDARAASRAARLEFPRRLPVAYRSPTRRGWNRRHDQRTRGSWHRLVALLTVGAGGASAAPGDVEFDFCVARAPQEPCVELPGDPLNGAGRGRREP